MELEEFKIMLDKNINPSTFTNKNITTMINQDVKGPLASYEKNLKFTLIIFPFVLLLFSATFISHKEAVHSPTKWLLLLILFIEFAFSFFNYGITKKMRSGEGTVKQSILNKLFILQKSNQWFLVLNELLYLLMAVILEVSMYYHLDSNFEGWNKISVIIRITVYILFLLVLFFVKRNSQRNHYGRYLDNIQQLAGQLNQS